MTKYPIVANCNYESRDDELAGIHRARLAVEKGFCADAALLDALAALEVALTAELSPAGEYRHGVLSQRILDRHEAAVLAAWHSVDEVGFREWLGPKGGVQ